MAQKMVCTGIVVTLLWMCGAGYVNCASIWISASPLDNHLVTAPTRERVINDVIGSFHFVNITQDKDVYNYFDTCPMFEEPLHVMCYQHEHTCTDRCGQIMRLNNFGAAEGVCSCDVFCGAMGDCCWDFQDVCLSESEEFETNHAHLRNLEVTCENGAAIIESQKAPTTGLISKENIIVTHKRLGMTFRNDQTFKYYFNEDEEDPALQNGTNTSDLVFWAKELIFRFPVSEIKDVRESMYTMKELLSGEDLIVRDRWPANSLPRACKQMVNVMCFSGEELDYGNVEEESGDLVAVEENDEVEKHREEKEEEEEEEEEEEGESGGSMYIKLDQYEEENEPETEDDETARSNEFDGSNKCDSLTRYVTLSSLSSVCEIYQESQPVGESHTTTSKTKSTNGLLVVPQNDPSVVTPLMTSEMQKRRGGRDGENYRKCYAKWYPINPVRDISHTLKIVFTVEPKDRNIEVFAIQNRNSAATWQNVSCSSMNGDRNCNLYFKCMTGYILIEGECRVPTKLILYVVGQEGGNKHALTSVLNGVTYAIMNQCRGEQGSFVIAGNGTESELETFNQSGQKFVRIQSEMALAKYDLDPPPVEAGNLLPVASQVSSYLSAVYKRDAPFERVVICFGTDKQISGHLGNGDKNDSLVVCDTFDPKSGFHPNQTHPAAENIDGLLESWPFSDALKNVAIGLNECNYRSILWCFLMIIVCLVVTNN